MGVKFAHVADLQLGFRKFSSAYSQEREQDFYRVWLEAVDTCISQQVDFVLIVGDIFDESDPPVAALKSFFDGLVKLVTAGIEVIVVDGNHERPKNVTQAHPLSLFEGLGVHLVYGQSVKQIVTKTGLSVCAVPYAYKKVLQLEDLYEADICAVHAGCTVLPDYMQGNYVWDTRWDSHYDYVALGDWHAPMVTGDTSRYAGSLERTSFGDAHTEVGFWIVEVTGHRDEYVYTPEYLRTTARPILDLAIRADREASIVTQLEHLINTAVEDTGIGESSPLVRVTVTGSEPVNVSDLKKRYPFIKIVWRKRSLDRQRVGVGDLNAMTVAKLWDEYCVKTEQTPVVRKLGGELLEQRS